MNAWLNKLVLDHIMKEPAISLALVALLARVDHVISALLKVFSKDQIEGALDKADAVAKAEVDKVAGEQKP